MVVNISYRQVVNMIGVHNDQLYFTGLIGVYKWLILKIQMGWGYNGLRSGIYGLTLFSLSIG